MQKNHHSPKDRDHQSDGIFRRKNRLSRDFTIIGGIWLTIRYQKLIKVYIRYALGMH